MRSDQQYLLDIVEAADAIARFITGIDRTTFLKDEIRQSAVIQKIGVIGEAAGKVSSPMRSKYPHVEWPKVVGMRNILVHAYFSIKLEIVWQTATISIPELREKVARILAAEFDSG